MMNNQDIINRIESIIKLQQSEKEDLWNNTNLEELISNEELSSLLNDLFKNIKGIISKEQLESYGSNESLQIVLKAYLAKKDIAVITEDVVDLDNDFETYYDEDSTKAYLRETRRFPLLNSDEEKKLILLKEQGDLQASMKLVEHNLRLVVSIAKRYLGRGMEFLDLIQEGNLGLIKAVSKFDSSFGCRFSTYATYWIHQAIGKAIQDKARTIRIPVHMEQKNTKIMKAKRDLLAANGIEPTPTEISLETNISEDIIKLLLTITATPKSLDKPVEDDEESLFGDFIKSDSDIELEKEVMNEHLKIYVENVLKCLTSREKQIIMLRTGISTGQPMTLEEVGEKFDITRERVRQIEEKALRKLRHPRNTRKIKDYVD